MGARARSFGPVLIANWETGVWGTSVLGIGFVHVVIDHRHTPLSSTVM